MTRHRRRLRRRIAIFASRMGVAVTGTLLVVGVFGNAAVLPPSPAAAAESDGTPGVASPPEGVGQPTPITEGGSATPFVLLLPDGAACTGDTANDGYLVQSYIVPASVDPATLQFGGTGPIPTGSGANLRRALYSGTTPYANRPTDLAPSQGAGGPVVGVPAFNFAIYGDQGPTVIPPGAYNLGIACSLDGAIDRFWNVRFDFVTDLGDEPAGITWSLAASEPQSTTVTLVVDPSATATVGEEVTLTAMVTPSSAAGSITFFEGDDEIGDPEALVDGVALLTTSDLGVGTHTLVAAFEPAGDDYLASTSSPVELTVANGSTTTTSPTDTTTTSNPPGTDPDTGSPAPPSLVSVAGDSAVGPSGPTVGALPLTGGSTVERVILGLLLVLFGRISVLLARAPVVRPIQGP